MSAVERLRDVEALLKAWQSELSMRQHMLENDSHYESVLRKELAKLERQKRTVDVLLSYRGEGAQDKINEIHDRMAELRKERLRLKHAAKIERLIKLQRDLEAAQEDMRTPLSAAAAEEVSSAPADDAGTDGDDLLESGEVGL